MTARLVIGKLNQSNLATSFFSRADNVTVDEVAR
jgi:hypothetical protein